MTVTLLWNKRYPKKHRRVILEILQYFYPKAIDAGEGIQLQTRKTDRRPVSIFLLWKCFAGIE